MSFESVCKFYSYNRNCKFGTHCRYLHSDISQRPPPYSSEEISHGTVKGTGNKSQVLSAHFVQTQANLGESNHEDSLNSSHQTHLRTATVDLGNSVSKRSDDDVSQGVIPLGLEASVAGSIVDKDISTTTTANVCRYFKQHGYCAFGRNCRFLHSQDSGSRPTASKARFSQNERKQIPPRFQKKAAVSPTKSSADALHSDEREDVNASSQIEHANACNELSNPSVDDADQSTRNASAGSRKLCRYFKSGYCSRGRRCMFLHYRLDEKERDRDARNQKAKQGQSEKALDNDEASATLTTNNRVQTNHRRPVSVRPTGVLPQVVKLSELKDNGYEKYRQFDINYLKKRFQAVDFEGGDEVEESVKLESNVSTLEMTFSPSDPDWPFDVSSFILHLMLPENYPELTMSIAVPSDKQDLPDTVRRYLEICMNEWISDRQKELTKNGKAELMVRPFFRWLDRNFEDVMTEALKQLKRELTARAAGFEFISATQLQAKYAVDEENDDYGSTSQEDDDDDDDDDDESSDECLESDDGSGEYDEEDEDERQPTLGLDTARKGTEIQLRHLQLKQNASSLLFERLRLIVQCGRCKTHSEVSLGGDKAVALTCGKCNHEMYIQFRPTLVHQFSSIIGYLDLDNCQAFDLIFQDCKIVVSCLSCGKLTKINGMTSGQMVDGWCQACNARFKFAAETVKFYQLQPSTLDEEKKQQAEVARPKGNRKPPKDPAIREGEPLPDFGACRHYKQSYRWLRFPCCGKAYPCDVCHDKKEDHEMTFANRMICGHCCKEQNYSASRPCDSCGHHMTKIRSAHWEGGMGCRDRIAMSRNDQQKYKNMNKTVSRKKVSSGAGAKKKNTKLRHA